MQPSIRYGLAVFVGASTGVLGYFGANPVVDGTVTWFAAGLNALVWTAGIALYLNAYERLNRAPSNVGENSSLAAAKWGGAGGGVASLGISGTALLLITSTEFRYVAVVGLFVFGLVLASMAVGMGTVAGRFVDENGRPKGTHSSEEPRSSEEARNASATSVD